MFNRYKHYAYFVPKFAYFRAMPGNHFGGLYKITTFGESHGKAIGVSIDGCPSGIELDLDWLQTDLARRKPGQSVISTQRKEDEAFEIISGYFEGKTTGTPLTFLVHNKDQRSRDYDHIKTTYRPSHADYTYDAKYGHRDYRGGGRSSARETAMRVIGGNVAKQVLANKGIAIQGYVSQVGTLKVEKAYQELDLTRTENNIVRCPDQELAEQMIEAIKAARKQGDTLGGIVSCVIKNCPPGLGEPVFDRLHAQLGKAMLSINAVKGFEYGSGFDAVKMKGSEHNDHFYMENGKLKTKTNFSGGIQGGISNGMDIYFNVAFKPVATIMQDQPTVNKAGDETIATGKGRHDPCVVPRAVPIVEAMAAMVLLDNYLMHQAYNAFRL